MEIVCTHPLCFGAGGINAGPAPTSRGPLSGHRFEVVVLGAISLQFSADASGGSCIADQQSVVTSQRSLQHFLSRLPLFGAKSSHGEVSWLRTTLPDKRGVWLEVPDH